MKNRRSLSLILTITTTIFAFIWLGLPSLEASDKSNVLAFALLSHQPTDNAVGVAVTSDITATFDADVAVGSVVSTSFAAHTQFTGLLTGTLSVSGDTITLDPNRDLFAGEQVQVIATADINSTGGMSLTSPTQWGFTAGPISNRCVLDYTDMGAGLTGVAGSGGSHSSGVWGDYDNDGDLDILLAGYDAGFSPSATIYNNNAGTFTDIGAGLSGFSEGSAAWGDYDNDGDLDILLTGYNSSFVPSSVIYRNDAGTFTDIGAGLTGVIYSSVAWGDYDNDGDLDILLTGYDSGFAPVSIIYRNDAGTFTDIGAGLTDVSYSSAAWGDYDNDGDLDILLTGYDSGFAPASIIYRNDAGIFTDIGAGLTDVGMSSVAWGDYDNDSDLDILLTGYDSGFIAVSIIYRNDAGIFTDIGAGLTGVGQSSAAWGDHDNDGNLDILLIGDNAGSKVSHVYRNNAGTFSDIGAGLTGLSDGSATWGDADNDGALEILLTGVDAGSVNRALLYKSIDCFDFTSYGPLAHAVGVTTTTNITATFDANLDSGTVVSTTFAAHTQFGGLLTGTLSVINNAITLDPNRELFAGERVQVIASTAIQDTGGATLKPFQWGFTAGLTTPRCLVGFTDIGAGLTGVSGSNVAWGDYDNDGDLDALVTGFNNSSGRLSAIYRNDAGTFTDIGAGLTDVSNSAGNNSSAWGDYDNDGDLDILLTGESNTGFVSQIYRNDAGIFTDIGAGLPGVRKSSVAWGDYDNDGDLDILIAGEGGFPVFNISRIYRNDAGTFTDIMAGLPWVITGSVAWGDYDNDGDLDLLLTGFNQTFGLISRVYRNDNGAFTDIVAGLPGVQESSVDWGDYDNDGDLDILLIGYTGFGGTVGIVYRNDAGAFTDIGLEMSAFAGRAAWGDYDSDGDLDILVLNGTADKGVYQNNAGTFTQINAGLTDLLSGASAWGDYDKDGDLDILTTGQQLGVDKTFILENDGGAFIDSGTPGQEPCTFAADISLSSGDVMLSWSAPTPACVYDVYEENTPYVFPVTPAYTNQSSGVLYPTTGNPVQNYYYVIEAICGGQSLFSSEMGEFDFAIVPGS